MQISMTCFQQAEKIAAVWKGRRGTAQTFQYLALRGKWDGEANFWVYWRDSWVVILALHYSNHAR